MKLSKKAIQTISYIQICIGLLITGFAATSNNLLFFFIGLFSTGSGSALYYKAEGGLTK